MRGGTSIKQHLYKIFIVKPIGLIFITLIMVVSLYFVFKDVYIKEYYEVSSNVDVNLNKLTMDIRITDKKTDIHEGDKILVYWDANKLSFNTTVSKIDSYQNQERVTLAVNQGDSGYLTDINEKEKAKLRIYTDSTIIWKRLFD